MSDQVDYYNNFYKELAIIDRAGNSFSKIEKFVTNLPPKSKVLDVGCGFGSVSEELISMGHTVYGMEVNKEAIIELSRKQFRVIEHDITQPFNLAETFDLVLLLDVLEHVFDPMVLLKEAVSSLNDRGEIVVSVPLYFDLRDRLRILFTGSVVSYDNLVYGRGIFKKMRSFNYDHIRFFRPSDLHDMCKANDLEIVQVKYAALGGLGNWFLKLIMNNYTANWWPSLLAHSMVLRAKKR